MLRAALFIFVLASPAMASWPFSLRVFAAERREGQVRYERSLNEAVSADRLRSFHDLVASEPHVAGTAGDHRTIERIAGAFREAGLEVEVHWIWPYLSKPVGAAVEIVAPERVALRVSEPPIEADPDTAHPDLTIAFNAYSGSGDVTAEVVYANFGRKEDFERLRSLGVDCRGKIVVARYGGNFRGYKAKFAEQAGAAGLIIYTDPADSGYMRGLMNPEGGWANEHQVQRGSLQTMPYSGDPLTPNEEATEEASRLDPEGVPLPRIPVQPVAWSAAGEILERMEGRAVPEEGWQGALPFPYRLEGGPSLRVRLMVKQERSITKTANVIGTLRGSTRPDELVVAGCHHDAWGFGAADPTAGTHVLLESARVFGEAARAGERPERTIVFAAWAAEEHGIIGSGEWVEANLDRLRAGGIAYFNLDMAAMGPLFSASGSPTLTTLIADATRGVPQCRETSRTVFEEWTSRRAAMKPLPAGEDDAARFVESMGGGSDHVGFYFHACMPCASVGASGSRGTSYHSNYDTLRWYRRVVGEDYEPSVMVTRVLNVCLARLARADRVPLDASALGATTRRHLDDLEKRATDAALTADWAGLRERTRAVESACIGPGVEAAGPAAPIEHAFWLDGGLPKRPWFRNAYMAPDRDSGYSAWPLPLIREAVEERNQAALDAAVSDFARRLDRVAGACAGASLAPEPSVQPRADE